VQPAQNAPSLPDLSEAAKKACDSKKGEFWDQKRGCFIVLDEPDVPLLIDPSSSSVDHYHTEWQFNSVPMERSIGGILSLP